MKLLRIFLLFIVVPILAFGASMALGADLVIPPQTLNGPDPKIYDSAEGIIFDGVVISNEINVTAVAAYEVSLVPVTRIKNGCRFEVKVKDNDGLPNRWEMQYFGNLDQDPDGVNGDFDDDGLTNLQEFQVGTDPTVANADNDDDGLPDQWELQYSSGLTELDGRNGDNDLDGISNWIEYKLDTDPTETDEKGPGLHYEYDKLGRMKKILRIPSR